MTPLGTLNNQLFNGSLVEKNVNFRCKDCKDLVLLHPIEATIVKWISWGPHSPNEIGNGNQEGP